MKRAVVVLVLSLVAFSSRGASTAGPASPTIEQFLAPGTPTEIVAAKKAERIAWTAYEHGLRNVYTAAAPVGVAAADVADLVEVVLGDLTAVAATLVQRGGGHDRAGPGRVGPTRPPAAGGA